MSQSQPSAVQRILIEPETLQKPPASTALIFRCGMDQQAKKGKRELNQSLIPRNRVSFPLADSGL
jgi:hypothetical protein